MLSLSKHLVSYYNSSTNQILHGACPERLEELNEELEVLNAEAREFEERIGENVTRLLEEL